MSDQPLGPRGAVASSQLLAYSYLGYIRVVAAGMRVYRHVGPAEVLATVRPDADGHVIGTRDDLVAWLCKSRGADAEQPFSS